MMAAAYLMFIGEFIDTLLQYREVVVRDHILIMTLILLLWFADLTDFHNATTPTRFFKPIGFLL